jgi:TonB-linked SusC/RagA family outer membrane protein
MKKKKNGFYYSSRTRHQISKHLKTGVLLIIFGLLGITGSYAQARQITGKVTDDQGTDLPGVNVVVKGTSNGTVTDFDGLYVLNDVASGDILVFSSVGMISKEVTVGNQTEINVSLLTDVQQLDEVIVVGYTSTTRKNLSSSVAQLDNKEVTGLVVTDVKQSIQGKVAGVQVVNNSGDPGAGSRIVIRGMGSFTNSEPLYVIDGIQGGDINSIPQGDIKSISILKDAATTAIYGSAGANGVVVITTKKGAEGNVKVDYNGSVGIATVSQRYDMVSPAEYVDLVRDIQQTNGLELTDKLKSDYVLVQRTDWQDEVFRNGTVTDHDLSISGGTNSVNYAFNTGYQYQEGTIIDRDFERLNLGLKLNEKLFKDRVRLGQTIRYKEDTYRGVLGNLESTLKMPEYLPVYDETNLGGYSRTDKLTDLQDARNPLNGVYNSRYKSGNISLNIDLFAEIDIYDGLMFKSQARISKSSGNSYNWNYPSMTGNGPIATSMKETYYNWSSFFWENFLTYSKTFAEDHTVNATLGMSYQPAGEYRSISAAGSDYTSDAIKNISLANTKDITGAAVNSGKSRLSYFASLGYIYKNKYILNATFRRDASSVFGEENRWGNFYGIGGAWTISQEDFLADNDIISYLKLRASYGKTGNDNIPGGLTSSTVWKGWSNNIVYTFGDDTEMSTGSTINSVPNPYLKWEETTQFDVGLDIGFMDNKLNFVLDYYKRNNDDLLIQTVLPLTAGLGLPGQSGTQWINAASMVNNGFEFSATYRSDQSHDFHWDLTLNTTYNKNEVTDLGTIGDTPISAGQFMDGVGNPTRTDIGHPIGSFYGYRVDHVAVDQAEVDKLNQQAIDASGGAVTEYSQGLKPGDFIFKDIDGNGYLDTEDRTYIGNPSPKWQYGITFNADYKGFDFQLFMQGVADVEVVNGSRYWLEGMSRTFNATTRVLDRWRAEGDHASLPRAGQNSGVNLAFSDFYVESGDYFRIRNIAIGYTFPESFLGNVFSKTRLYLAIQNAYTFTNYSGYDPEISTIYPYDSKYQTFARGIDWYNRPNPTIYRIGVQLNF